MVDGNAVDERSGGAQVDDDERRAGEGEPRGPLGPKGTGGPRPALRLTIEGQPFSKANRRRPVILKMKGGRRRPAIVKSREALAYVKGAQAQLAAIFAEHRLPRPYFPPGTVVKVTALIFYASRRPDLDESVLLDVLEGFAYANDRQVEWKDIRKGLPDAERPRVEIDVEEILPLGSWRLPWR